MTKCVNMMEAEIEIAAKSYPMTEELTTLLRVLSKPYALKLLYRAEIGIENSTHVIKELDTTQKTYYARLKGLLELGLVKKVDGVYNQTALGKIMHDRFLPAMGRTFEAKDKLELLEYIEETQIENNIRTLIGDELKIPGLEGSPKVKLLGDYEALAIEAIDLSDSAEERILLASNYLDLRVMETFFRAVDRGVDIRIIMGKKGLSSKFNQLRMMLSLEFAKALINFSSNTVDLKEAVRVVDLPYTFCVVDGRRSIMEISNPRDERFLFSLSIDDRFVSEMLTEVYEFFWKEGEFHTALNLLRLLKKG